MKGTRSDSSGHQASQVANRDQFAVTQVTIEVMKRSRNPPRFEKDRYEGFIYSNSVPESMILRDRTTNRPFRVRARDEDFAAVSSFIGHNNLCFCGIVMVSVCPLVVGNHSGKL